MTDDLAVLAHELRTPIAALTTIVETLAERGDALTAAQRQRFLELAVAAARDVERLLDEAPAEVAPVDVGVVVRDVVETTTAGGADVSARVDEGLRPVLADPARLRQALRNLVENAVAHGQPVIVVAVPRDGAVVVSVTDAGEGIAPADQARIFERGVRLTDRPGSGIGLAVVREVVDELGGSIEVVSAPGQGATFTLVLPPASASD